LFEVIVDGGESATNLNRPGLQRLLTLVDSGKVKALIVAKLDRLTRSVKDLCGLLELFEKRILALILVAESLDTASAAGRLVITIMAAVPQWEREAIGEPTRSPATQAHQRGAGRGISGSDSVSARTASTSNPIPASKACSRKSVTCARAATLCEGSRPP
jgi:DNA invertase Pin-like site-specific DNA recombinase